MKTTPFTTKRSAIHALSVLLVLALPRATYGDGIGTLIFANRMGAGVSTSLFAPIYGPQAGFPSTSLRGNATTNGGTVVYTGPLLVGSGYTAALFYGPQGTTDESELTLSCSSVFRTNATLPGFIVVTERPCLLPGYAATNVICQVRAWDNKGATIPTWEAALADNSVARGSSDLMVVRAGNANSAAELPGFLNGLTSFCLYLPDGPGITAQPQDLLVPPGVTTNFSVGLAAGNGSETLQWQFNGTDLPGATSRSLVISNVGYMDAGRYSVVVHNASGHSLTSRNARLTVLPSISNIEHAVLNPFGVDVVRLTYESSPNTTIHVEAKTSPPGLTWEDLSAATSPNISNYFYDVFATNLSRIYRLRQD